MASGTITTKLDWGDSSLWKARMSWSSTTYSETNRSKMTVKLQCYYSGSANYTDNFSGWLRYDFSGTGTNASVIDEFEFYDKTLTVKPKTWTTIASYSFYVNHKSNGSRSVYLWTAFGADGDDGFGAWDDGWATLNTIKRFPTIASAPNFTDEDNPTMTYTVPLPDSTSILEACISFDGSNPDIPYRDLDVNGTSYTFNFTDEEREILRQGTLNGSNTKTVYFYIRYKVGSGSTTTIKLGKTLTIINAEPTLSALVMDTNEKTVALTGDRLASLIKGYSNVSYEMSGQALKGASIVSYSAVNGSNTLTTDTGTFNSVNSNTFKLSTTDNRGLTTSKEFTLNMIEYSRPTCRQEAEIAMSGETTAKITVEISGEWSSKHFGAVHNALRVECRYKTGNGEWSEWEGADYISDENTYKITYTKDGLLYSNAYTVQSRAVDLLDEAITGEYALKLIPVFDWSEDDFNFNVPVNVKGDLTVEGNIIIGDDSTGVPVDYIVEQGTEAMGTNGTWYWSKWKNGKAECYGIRNYGNMGVSTSWGELYVSPDFNQDLPSGLFAAAPDFISITPQSGGYGTWVSKGYEEMPTESTTGTFCVVRAKSNTLSQVNLSFLVIGRWK